MAKARVVRGEAPIVGVTLELTSEEASFLRTLIGLHVYGGGQRRTLADPIFNALGQAGVEPHLEWTGVGEVRFP